MPGDAYRFNWNTPFLLSPHNPSVLWFGGNRLFRSDNRGEMYVASADLTKQLDRCKIAVIGAPGSAPQLSKNDGLTSYGTIISVSESPVARGVVWAGTDDGNVQVSRDNGATFTEVGKNITGLPVGALSGDSPYWISRIEASHYDAGMAYVAIDGHRTDDLKPYIFGTRDYGRTWASVSGGLPQSGNVQVVKEDPRNRELLYAGTEFGLYISLDAGKSWEKFMTGYPTVRTDDILVHPRDGDLIVATHGRSLWIADDITPLQQLTPQVMASDATLFDVRPAVAYLADIRTDISAGGQRQFEGENPARGTAIQFYVKSAGDAKLSISDATGRAVCESSVKAVAGINRVQWTLVAPLFNAAGGGGRGAGGRGGPPGGGGAGGGAGAGAAAAGAAPGAAPQGAPAAPNPNAGSCTGATGGRGGGGTAAAPGSYVAKLTVNGKEYSKPVTVLEDKWMPVR
jgi:hypothetical protein